MHAYVLFIKFLSNLALHKTAPKCFNWNCESDWRTAHGVDYHSVLFNAAQIIEDMAYTIYFCADSHVRDCHTHLVYHNCLLKTQHGEYTPHMEAL